jgi:hypothetical protein
MSREYVHVPETLGRAPPESAERTAATWTHSDVAEDVPAMRRSDGPVAAATDISMETAAESAAFRVRSREREAGGSVVRT